MALMHPHHQHCRARLVAVMAVAATASLGAILAWYSALADQRRSAVLAELQEVSLANDMVQREAVGEAVGQKPFTAMGIRVGDGLSGYQPQPAPKPKIKKR
jgi:hypothetical protein